MDREMRILHEEIGKVIRLHRYGLTNTDGYRSRKKWILDYIRDNNINVEDLDPLTLILYRRYFE